MPNKYHARRTYSQLIKREFDSKGEAERAEELYLLQKAGEISDLEYQVKFVLSKSPKITCTIDFKYVEDDKTIYEDHKGVLTRDSRTKYAWIKSLYGIDIKLHRRQI